MSRSRGRGGAFAFVVFTSLALADSSRAGEPTPWMSPTPTRHSSSWGLLDLDRSLGSSGWSTAHTLTGDWGGLRDRLADDYGISVLGTYTAEVAGNPVGGLDQNVRYTHNIGIALAVDLGKLVGLPETYFLISGSNRSGESNSGRDIGNLYAVQQIYGGQTTRLVQLALGKGFFDGALEIVAGRLDGLDDFIASPLYCNAQNLAFCGNPLSIPIDISIPSYPNTAWGARAKYQPGETWYAMAGAYNAFAPFRGNQYHGVDFSWRHDSGVVVIGELGVTPDKIGEHGLFSDLPGHYKFGGYTDTQPRTVFATGDMERGTWGVYVGFDQMLFREGGPGSNQGLTAFVTTHYAPPERNPQELFISGGLLYQGPIPGRDNDLLGFYVAYGQLSSVQRHAQIESGLPGQNFELVLELNYRWNVLPWFYIQPDVQGILNPGGAGKIDNAFVMAVQFGVPF